MALAPSRVMWTTAFALAFSLACTRGGGQESAAAAAEPQPSPPPAAVSKATLEPVYRAAKAVQGATTAGVSFAKFGELQQAFATELSIAKDQRLNELDQKVLALFQEAFDHYQASATLWSLKISAGDELWKGEIPVAVIGRAVDDTPLRIAQKYGFEIQDRELAHTRSKYRAIGGDAHQRIWIHADSALNAAADLYYGR